MKSNAQNTIYLISAMGILRASKMEYIPPPRFFEIGNYYKIYSIKLKISLQWIDIKKQSVT